LIENRSLNFYLPFSSPFIFLPDFGVHHSCCNHYICPLQQCKRLSSVASCGYVDMWIT
jgi:hypothetical protein